MKLIPKQQKRGGSPLEPWDPFYYGDQGDGTGNYSHTGSEPHGATLTPDGMRAHEMAEYSAGSTVMYQLALPTAFTFPGATIEINGGIISGSAGSYNYGIGTAHKFSDDGTRLFVLFWGLSGTIASVAAWDLPTAWDITGRILVSGFFLPENIMGITHDILRLMDVSADGTRLYIYDYDSRKSSDNPTNIYGVLFEYEMTTPFDLATLVESNSYILNERNRASKPTSRPKGLTVYSRGNNVEQIILASFASLESFLYTNGLEDKLIRDGDPGSFSGGIGSYIAYDPHKYVRGWVTLCYDYNGRIYSECFETAPGT